MGISDHLTCLLRNLFAGQEATVRTGHGRTDGSKLGNQCVKAVCCHPAYLTYMQSMSCEILGWMKHKLELRLLGENINNLRYADDTTLMAESEEELKSLLMKVKEESEKGGIKLNIQKTKIMACGPIISWQIDGETKETVTDFTFWVSRLTADGDYSHEIKTLALWKKSYNKLRQHIKKQRHHFASKGPYNQSHDFSSSHVWM